MESLALYKCVEDLNGVKSSFSGSSSSRRVKDDVNDRFKKNLLCILVFYYHWGCLMFYGWESTSDRCKIEWIWGIGKLWKYRLMTIIVAGWGWHSFVYWIREWARYDINNNHGLNTSSRPDID